ncbi:MAG: hypothetical protein H0W33_10795 [Gammaproteobacteria bacterium]|nr:hypothetical protein [Gammaproteobacteria bacterium]
MQYRLPPQIPSPHPVAKFLSFLGAIVALGVAFFLGVFFLAIVAGLILIGTAVIGTRVWWLRRKIRQSLERKTATGEEGTVIEGQYTVVDDGRASERRRDDVA